MTATDAAGNTSTHVTCPGLFFDDTRPPAPVLEVATDPAQQKVTLNWASVTADGAPVVKYHVRTKGPTGPPDVPVDASVNSLVFAGLQVDATYEYSLVASDACGDSLPSVRVVRLNDTAPPSQPILADPAFISSSKAVKLSWVPSTDNIQVDHYQILRNGIPLAATDATDFTDTESGTARPAELRRARRRHQRQHRRFRPRDDHDSGLDAAHRPGAGGHAGGHDGDGALARGGRQRRRRRLRRPARRQGEGDA